MTPCPNNQLKRKDIPTKRILEEYAKGPGGVYWRLIEATDLSHFPRKIIWSAMQRDFDKGYLDYGVNLSAGWLTEKGKNKLIELQNASLSK